MIIINNNFKDICRIDCSCCSDSHSITLIKDLKDNDLYFESKERGISFRMRFKFWLKMIFNWKSFTEKDNKDFFQLLITKDMAKQLIEILKREGYKTITKDFSINEQKKEYITIFDCKGVLITNPNYDKNILTMSLYPTEKINKWKYASGFSSADLNEKEVSEMMFEINKFIGEKNEDSSVN
jgi:flavorubredoxin